MTLADGQTPLDPPLRQRSTRDRPAKAPLSEGAVVDAALDILQSEGLEAVTMRRVAAALDTGAASLYVYVDGREGLLQTMLDRVVGTIEFETPDAARWRAQLHSVLQRLHEALIAHPGIAGMTLTEPPTTDAIMRLSENLLGILLAGGFDPQDAAWANDIFVSLVKAVTSEDDVRHAPDDDRRDRERLNKLHRTFAGLPPDRFPLITAHADVLVAGDSDARLTFAIDLVIDGLLARTADS